MQSLEFGTSKLCGRAQVSETPLLSPGQRFGHTAHDMSDRAIMRSPARDAQWCHQRFIYNQIPIALILLTLPDIETM